MPIVPVNEIANKKFDYVVVGGGTAGLTLAVRLSENSSKSVLCLEAGSANLDDPAILRPASWGSHFGNEKYDWGHKTVAQKFSNNVQHNWNRGKGLGGSSAINFMCYTRPPANEIDDIERLGNPGWNWKNFNDSLKKLEGYVAPSKDVAEKNGLRVEGWECGTSGGLIHSFPGLHLAADRAVQESLIASGFEHSKSPMGGEPAGVYFTTQSVNPKTYTRSYSTTAFYAPASNRENLTVTVDVLVSRIITEDASGKVAATAVEFIHEDQTYTVKVGSNVILSAGALKSPQILELSGIGKREVLEAVKIPVVVDLPGVGENLQEHVYTSISFELKDDVDFDTVDVLRNPEIAAKHISLHTEQKGLFTAGIMGFSFGSLNQFSTRAHEIHEAAIAKIEASKDSLPAGLYDQYRIQIQRLRDGAPGCEIVSIPGFMSFPNPPQPDKKYWSLPIATNHNFSRGSAHVVSRDAKIDPAFDPHYFEEQIDLDTILECVKFTRSLKDVAPFKDMIVAEVNPGPNCETEEQIINWIKNYTSTTYHTSSTCSMLPQEKNGVVDSNLVVYGTTNIRVCDLSIIPLHFSAHPQATVYGVAARAADVILGAA